MQRILGRLVWVCLFLSVGGHLNAAREGDALLRFLPEQTKYDASVTRPEAVLGFAVGHQHVRHDQSLQYLRLLAEQSPRARWVSLGRTHEGRELVHLVFSHPDNLANLEALRQEHLNFALTGQSGRSTAEMPVVVWLAYSIHGNEASGANAALVTAYHLAAAQKIDPLLRNTIILLDPSLNPDGMDRFATWVNSHRGRTPVADAYTREHREAWPRGRTNHYWFDLNRDWLLLQHPESQARVAQFQRWRPNVVADFHEMGTNATYFFQPGVPSRQNPLISEQTLTLTRRFAEYHARGLDERGELYFTEESFDDFFFGKGSTYPDAQGGIGILFEQASARGHVKHRFNGELTFADAIHNQVTTSLTTLEAALAQRKALLEYQDQSRRKALADGAKSSVKAYVVGDDGDPMRLHYLVKNLLAHRIVVHELAEPVRVGEQTISRGIVVPTEQAQYPLVTSLFERRTRFQDDVFYDISAWNFAMAHNLPHLELGQGNFRSRVMGPALTEAVLPQPHLPEKAAGYAYLLEWSGYFAPKAAYRLQAAGVHVWAAAKPFRAATAAGPTDFAAGTLMVPLGEQKLAAAEVDRLVREAAREAGIDAYALDSGLTPQGMDLGSRNFHLLKQPNIVVAVDGGVNSNRAGEIWFTLDHDYGFATALVACKDLDLVDWSQKTHLILPDGSLEQIDSKALTPIKAWLDRGGNLIALGGAVRWLDQAKWVNPSLSDVSQPQTSERDAKQAGPVRPRWADREKDRARKRISGAIFSAQMDLTHPLAFGYRRAEIFLFRNHTMALDPGNRPLSAPVRYSDQSLQSGYADSVIVSRLADKAAAQVFGMSNRGTVILLHDHPGFRGFWRGSNRLLLNSLFFNEMMQH